MQQQLDALNLRLKSVESNQIVLGTQADRIEANTADLISTFSALKGAWAVLDFIGKLGKPVGALVGIGGAWWWLKDHIKEILK